MSWGQFGHMQVAQSGNVISANPHAVLVGTILLGEVSEMAGHGPAPKPASRRAGHSNADVIPLRVLVAESVEQPDLPDFDIERDGELVSFSWPAQTVAWWQMWADSPLSANFTSTDWSELLDTSILHARLWRGDHKVAGELRLRVAKFGATPEDRARLRITFAQANEAEDKPPVASSSRARRGGLKALPAVGE
jgi:hypothetical protein